MRSLLKVNRYVVAGTPDHAAAMVETIGKALPVEARAFPGPREAWAFLGARPAPRVAPGGGAQQGGAGTDASSGSSASSRAAT
jgi:hypothetical protein